MPKRFFVTRHRGAITWAVRHGLRARKVEMANFDPAIVAPGDVVMGTLPVHLIAEVNRRGGHYWHLTMDLPEALRGRELTADEMDACGARLDEFCVQGMGPRSAVMGTPEAWEEADGRPVLHLCIATGQALPNVLPLIHGEWDRVAIFASPAMAEQARRLSAVALAEAQRRGLSGKPIVVALPAETRYAAIRDAVLQEVAKLRRGFPEHRLVLNITGGQKLMTLGFADALRSQASILYCNTDRGVLETIAPAGTPDQTLPDELLDLATYLRMQGFRITRQTGVEEGVEQGDTLARLRARDKLTATLALRLPQMDMGVRTQSGGGWVSYGLAAALHELAASAANSVRGGKDERARPFRAEQVARLTDGTRLNEAGRKFLKQLVSDGLLAPDSEASAQELRLVFTDLAAAVYLSGGYVEEFALLSAAAVGLPASHFGANVGIDLAQARAGRSTAEMNELDLALVWRNRLLIVECKAGRALMNHTQDILNKSATLLGAVAGLHGSSWILSTAELSRRHEDDVKDRADLNRLQVLDGPEALADLPERIAAWAGLPLPAGFRPWSKVLGERRPVAGASPAKAAKPVSGAPASRKQARKG